MPRTGFFVLLLTLPLFAANANAFTATPDCVKSGDTLSINNTEILKLKVTTEDGTPAGAYVEGTYMKKYASSDFGRHFQMKIGPQTQDTIEVYYSDDAKLPSLRSGDHLVVCGRYATNRNGFYGNPKSPDGAYINQTSTAWSEYAEDGFILVNGRLYN
jgi:hypothetical protein